MRIWFSYQRYALMGAMLLVGLGVAAAALDHAWWAWAVAALTTAFAGPLFVHIWRDYPRKWRATQLATRRIAAGTFAESSLRHYCGDPCWRVVATEILRRAGVPARRRRQLVAELRAEHDAESHALIIVDHEQGTLLRVEGGLTTRTPLPPRAT